MSEATQIKKEIFKHNLPQALESLIQKWTDENRSFYLSPENMFIYENQKLRYKYADSISKNIGDWSVNTNDFPTPKPLLAQEIDEIQYELMKDKFPETAFIITGNKCNISCHMCPYHGENKDYYSKNFSKLIQEVPIETLLKRIDKLKELGVKTLFAGPDGEFLLSKDWEKIYEHASKIGMNLLLGTNGTFIDKDVVKKLKKYKILGIKISTNALSFDTWTKLCGCKSKKMYDNMMNAPILLRDAGFDVTVSLVNTELNKHEIPEYIKYWIDKKIGVNIANRIADEDFYNGNPKINNLSKPYYMCASLGDAPMIMQDGMILPCCASCYKHDNNDSANLPKINIDEDLQTIREKYFNIIKDKSYKNICKNCVLYSLSTETNNSFQIHGYEGNVSNFGYGINPKKRKKTIKQRIKNEISSLKKKLVK